MNYEGKTAIVTGGASGIGLRVVERLWDAGATVVVADRDEAGLERISAEMRERVHTVLVDVQSETDIERMVAVARDLGTVSLAVNAAGLGEGKPVIEEDLDTWNRVIAVVLTGVFLSIKHQAREMVRAGVGGSIINLASINANIPTWGSAAYSAAKAGVEMLTRSSAYELAEHAIRVNCVSPGLVDTPMAHRTGNMTTAVVDRWLDHTPLGRVGTTDDIASAILYLGGDQSTWVTGHNLVVDGGLSHTAGPNTRDEASPRPEGAAR